MNATCDEYNEFRKVFCDKPRGHEGVHVGYVGSNLIVGWGMTDRKSIEVAP